MKTLKLTRRQIHLLLNKMVNSSGGTSLSDSEDNELGILQAKYPSVSLERLALEQSK